MSTMTNEIADLDRLWIVVEQGDMFEGTWAQFEDCFGGSGWVDPSFDDCAEFVRSFAEPLKMEWVIYYKDEG